MKRNLKQKMELYEEIAWNLNDVDFLASDILELIQMNKHRQEPEALFHTILDSLQVGFAMGYQTAKNEEPKPEGGRQ